MASCGRLSTVEVWLLFEVGFESLTFFDGGKASPETPSESFCVFVGRISSSSRDLRLDKAAGGATSVSEDGGDTMSFIFIPDGLVKAVGACDEVVAAAFG